MLNIVTKKSPWYPTSMVNKVEKLLDKSHFTQCKNAADRFISHNNSAQLTMKNHDGYWYEIEKITICETAEGKICTSKISRCEKYYYINIDGVSYKLYSIFDSFHRSVSLRNIIRYSIFKRKNYENESFADLLSNKVELSDPACYICDISASSKYYGVGYEILCEHCLKNMRRCVDNMKQLWLLVAEILILDLRNRIFSYLLERKFYKFRVGR